LPDRDADRPRPVGLLAVALAALCAGLALSQSLSRLEPRRPTSSDKAVARPSRSSGGQNDASVAVATKAIDTATRAAATLGADQSAAIATRAPETPDAGQNTARLSPPAAAERLELDRPQAQGPAHLQRGIIAYLRCDGIPQLPGRIPCPRDLAFEQQVWRALHELERCQLTAMQRGQAEVRLVLGRSGYEGTRVYTPSQDGLDPATVTKCAGRALSSVRTTLRPERMIVRFLFELR
jgi:hypothetical protein